MDELAEGWVVWSEEATKVVLAYRPDVFDESAFPAACLPTVYVTKGRRSRRPGRNQPDPDALWYVTLFLEPEVSRDAETFEAREDALAGARAVAGRFARGEVDYRGLYQVPREGYLDRLDELTGRDEGGSGD